MQDLIKSIVGWLLILSALGFYGYGLGRAIYLSCSRNDLEAGTYPEVLMATVNSIQALLLTNLGIVLGISVAKPNSAIAHQVLFKSRSNQKESLESPLEIREKAQLFALIIFLIGLIACLITWAYEDFTSESKMVVSVVSSSGHMFIGVVLAYLTAVFSRPQS